MHIFRKFCLRQSDERTNSYKTRNVVNTDLNATFEDPLFKRSHPRKDRGFFEFSRKVQKLDIDYRLKVDRAYEGTDYTQIKG